jgi:hypothetical protein
MKKSVLPLVGVVAAAVLVGGRTSEEVEGAAVPAGTHSPGMPGNGEGALPGTTAALGPSPSPESAAAPGGVAPAAPPISHQVGIMSVAAEKISGRYCGSTLRYLAAATISVPRGPVTVRYRWTVNGEVIGPAGLQWVVFGAGGQQAEQVTQEWQSGWGLPATLRLEIVEWEAAPAVGTLEIPQPASRQVNAVQCETPDIEVAIVAANVVPAPCGGVVQLVIVSHVTLGNNLAPTDGEIHLFHNLQRNDGHLELTVVLTFVPGGATVHSRTTVWALPAVLGYHVSFTSRATIPSVGSSWSDSADATVICL